MIKEMEKELFITITVIYTTENLKMIKEMVRELLKKKMETDMKVNGSKIKFMDMENFQDKQEIII
jgi:hypothetical protein